MVRDSVSVSEARVDAQLRDYNSGDAANFALHYAVDAVCLQLPEGKVIASGREEIVRVYRGLFERRRAIATIKKRIVLGDYIVDHECVTNTETGAAFDAIAAYQTKDGLIQNVWFLGPAIAPEAVQ